MVAIEESWTFIGDDSDAELSKRLRDYDPRAALEHRGGMPSLADRNLGERGRKALEAVEPVTEIRGRG